MNNLYIFLALAVNVIVAILISLRYRCLLSFIEKKISRFSAFIIVCIAFFINYIVPFKVGAFISGPIAAKLKEKISLKGSSSILIFEQLFDSLWQGLIILFAIFFSGFKIFQNRLIYTTLFIIFISLILIYFVINYNHLINILFRFYRIFPQKVKLFIQKAGIRKDNSLSYLGNLKLLFIKKEFILKYIIITILIILINPLNVFLLSSAFSFSLSYFISFFIYWLSFIIGRLSGLPGGIGLRDASMAAFFISFGISALDSAKIVFFYRLISFFPYIPVALISIIYFGKGKLLDIYNEVKSLKEK